MSQPSDTRGTLPSPHRDYAPPPSPSPAAATQTTVEPSGTAAAVRTTSTGGITGAAIGTRLPGQQRPPGGPQRQRPAAKMKMLQQQLKHHEELSESLRASPVHSSRIPAERDQAEDMRRTRQWQWLKAAEVGILSHLATIFQQEQREPLVGAPGLLAHTNENGDTALHRCAALGHVDCVDWLLEHGADPNQRNRDGLCAADLADAPAGHVDRRARARAPQPEPEVTPVPAGLARATSRTPRPSTGVHVQTQAQADLARRAELLFIAFDFQRRGTLDLEVVRPYTGDACYQQLRSASPNREITRQTWVQVLAGGADLRVCSSMLTEIEQLVQAPPQSQANGARPAETVAVEALGPAARTFSQRTHMTGPEPSLVGSPGWESESVLDSPRDFRSHDTLGRPPIAGTSLAPEMTGAALSYLPADTTQSTSILNGTDLYDAAADMGHDEDNICERSCFLFGRSGLVHKACCKIIAHKGPLCCGRAICGEVAYFESLCVLLIAANSIFLAMYDPLDPDGDWNKFCDFVGNIFTVLFSIEMSIKMIAQGVILGKHSYLKDGFWNWLDLLVVGTGYLDVFGVENQFGVLRTAKLLRPLRTIGAIKGLRQQVEVLMQRKTLENIGNVCLLMIITFSVFSIVGVRLFAGTMRAHCYDSETLEVIDEEGICQPENDQCEDGTFCSDTDPLTGELNPNPAYDILGFDDFGSAILTVFVCTTLEGWTDVMYMIQDGYSDFAWIYFVLLILCGSIIIINLFLAVISGGYEDSVAEEMENKRFHKMAVQCIEMMKAAVHDAIIQPTAVQCHIGQKVQLNDGAISRLHLRNRTSIYNLSEDSVGTVKAVGQGGRVRVQTEDGHNAWHDTANIVPLGLGPPPSVGGVASPAAEEDERVAWYEASAQAEGIDARISQFLGLFEIVDFQQDRVMTYEEFHRGLIAFHDFCASTGEAGVQREMKSAVYVADEAVRAMLQILADPDPKGRDKKWQQDMLRMMFVSMDADKNEALSQGEFYDTFVHPQLMGEDANVDHVTMEDLTPEKLRGKSAKETFVLYCQFLSYDSYFGQFITAVVLVNCTVLALDYHNMPACGALVSGCVLDFLNLVCTLIFFVEMIIKLNGLGWRLYIADSFNIFDGTIVFLSLVEFFIPGDGGGISVFRALRILRIFKAAARFENLKKVIMTIVLTLPELANFFILLSLAVFFYAVLGLQLYGGTYGDLEEYPRVNFDSFWWSLMTVFQVLTGEDWNAAMFDAIHTNGMSAAAFFISLIVIGGYVLLNLFLAVLLMKTHEAFEKPPDMRMEVLQRAHKENYVSSIPSMEPTVESYDRLEGKSFFVMSKHSNFRQSMRDIVRNKSFDNGILLCIMISSMALALEEPDASPGLLEILDFMDYGFTIIFLIEMTLKIAVLNFYWGASNAYLKDPWNVLDFCVVCASVLSRVMDSDKYQWVKSFRVLRALRPLRVIQRVPELKMVVNSLFKAIPIITNVIVLLAMFWLIFGILGVQLFKGQFYSCSDPEVLLQHACSGTFFDEESTELLEREWGPPEWGFDNIVVAVITLFEVSTLERWLDIMYLCIDAVGTGHAPVELHSPMMGLFFMLFIMFGSFFMLELFVSAIVAAYTMMNEESDGTAFQSERQRRIVSKMVIGTREDEWSPKYEWQQPIYDLVSSKNFENTIIVLIVLNTVTMALFFKGMDKAVEAELDWWNSAFTVMFLLEALLKLLALSPTRYFHGPNSGWNCFDFFIVAVTTTELIFTVVADRADTIPGATVLRVFRIARIFRLLAKFKGLTNLFLAIVQALPTILNVGTVLFLVYFIYAILAMNLFGKVKRGEFLSERANFETFGVSLLTVFRMSTGESWNGIMMDCRVVPPDCTDGVDCGNYNGAPLFFISFQIFGQYLMLNLFVAVMLEFYQRQQEAVEQYLGSSDRLIFEQTWANFVGRDHSKPYRKHNLMPAELFDQFMYALPERLGWSEAERTDDKLKREAYMSLSLPTRAMNVLVPWRPGQHWTRSGLADTEWQDAQDLAEEEAAEARQMHPTQSDASTVPLAATRLVKPSAASGLIEDESEADKAAQKVRDRELAIRSAMEAVEEQAEKQERARLQRGGRPMHTDSGSPGNVAAWKYLRKRAKIAGIPASKIESFGRDQDGVGGDKEGLIALLLATETTTEQWSQRLADDTLTESERSELMRLNQSGDIDRVLVCAPRLLCTPF